MKSNIIYIKDFIIDKEAKEIISCPSGYEPIESTYIKSQKRYYGKFETDKCNSCTHIKKCPVKIKNKFGMVKIYAKNEEVNSGNINKEINSKSRAKDSFGFSGDEIPYAPEGIEDMIMFSHMMAGRNITDSEPKFGKFYDENGVLTYEGQIKDDIQHGYGKLFYPNGNIEYEGEFKLGIPHGFGKLYDENGCIIFVGKFKDGKPYGKNQKDIIDDSIIEIIGTYEVLDSVGNILNDIDKSPYDVLLGVRYLVLGELFQLKAQFLKKKSNIKMIEFLIEDIKNITNIDSLADKEKIKNTYKDIIQEIKEIQTKSNYIHNSNDWNNPLVRAKEISAINQEIKDEEVVALKCCNSILIEIEKAFKQLIEFIEPLYNYYLILSLIKIASEIMINLEENINTIMYKPLINVYVNNKGELIEYTILEDVSMELRDLSEPIVNITKNTNILKNDYLKDIYEKLTEKGRILFSTGELMYKDAGNYKEFTIDYWPYISSYIKCIECEVRDRIGEILIKRIPEIKTPLTLGSFNYAFKRYSTDLEKILNKKIDKEIVDGFDYLLKLRNPNTHDNIFTYEEYISVRNLLVDGKLLEKIIEIEPIEKTLIDEEDMEFNDNYLLNSAKVEGVLRETVDYKMINNLKFNDNALGVNLLNYFSNILFNNPFVIEKEIYLDTYIQSEIDKDTYGFLAIKGNSIEMGLGVYYDYAGLQAREDGIDILYRANIWEENLPLAGAIKVRDYNGQIYIYGDDNIQKIKRYSYDKLLADKEDKEFYDTFKRFNKKVLNMLLDSLEDNNVKFSKELIMKIIGSEDVWLSRDLNPVISSYRLVKSMITALYKNINSYDLSMKRIIVNASMFCVENIRDINNSQEYHLFPYAIIKVKGEEVIEIKLEKIKDTDNNKTIFEIAQI